jgi:DNA invertase Pin-like site-specific DNA recombinase
MKAILYTRVSTQKQASEGESLETQRTKLVAYAEYKGYDYKIVTDAGLSGTKKNRPGFQYIIDCINKKSIDAVIVYSLSRFARSTVDTLETVNRMQKKDISFHSLSEQIDTTTAMGTFFLTVLAGLSQLERDLISERTAAVLQHKKSQRKVYGQIPYGLTLDSDGETLVECEQEHETIAIVRSLHASGASLSKIAAHLESTNRLNKDGNPSWGKTQVSRLLKAMPAQV